MENSDKRTFVPSARHAYIASISSIGILILGWALFNIDVENIATPSLLIGLIILNAVAQLAVISTKYRGVAFGTSQAVDLAAVAILGLELGIIVAVCASLTLVVIKAIDREKPWKNSFEQIAFNTAMEAIALYCGGTVLLLMQDTLSGNSLLVGALAWLVAALVFDQVNRFTLIGILYITGKVKPSEFIWGHTWATPINITIGTVGGYVLTAAVVALDWQGILLFVMPFVLSAYSLRMYVKETDKQQAIVYEQTQQLFATNARLDQVITEKERVLSVLSHDMRSSLFSLQSSAEFLRINGDADPNMRQDLFKLISRSGSNLISLVENVINVEQSNTRPLQLKVDTFDISKTMQAVVDSLDAMATEKEIALNCELDDVPVIMSADRQMLRHVIHNLVTNAIKYTPTGGTVSVKIHAQPHCVMLVVEDSGIGIPVQEKSRVFEPYYRIPEHVKGTSGTGLGLTIVRRFVEAHDGSIDIQSRPNQGSTFQVRLPYKAPVVEPTFMQPILSPA